MKKKLKIAWFHPHLLNWMGGGIFIYEVCKKIRKSYEIVMLTSVASPMAKRQMMSLGIPVFELSGKSTYDFLYWLFLKKFIKKESSLAAHYLEKCDLVISSHFPSNIIAANSDKHHIYCCWEPCAFFYDDNYINGLNFPEKIFIRSMGFFYKKLDMEATKKADKILTLSDFNKKWIEEIYGRKDAIITYEGVDSTFFRKLENKNNPLKEKYKGFKIIIHSTDFTAIKGTDYLINSLPIILKEIPNLKLLITSTLKNQKKKKALENMAKKLGVAKSIVFLGTIDDKLLPDYYNIADVIVQPSIKQSMSLSVKEAMACEIPVVTSDEGIEQFKNGKAGFLVSPKNVLELSRAIIEILKNKNLARKMGKMGREIVINKFSWDTVADIFIKTIKDI